MINKWVSHLGIILMSEYDSLVSVYDAWSAADPAAALTSKFYLELCSDTDGEIVELGIGSGRIALEVAKLRKHIVGIDISQTMLDECMARARQQGLESYVELIKADIQTFILNVPANLIILPFRTIGHLLTMRDKARGLSQIFQQLRPGGRFVFDHYVFNRTWANNNNGVPRLMYKKFDRAKGVHQFVWDTYLYNFVDQLMDCTITVEETGLDNIVVYRKHSPLTFSWVEPHQIRELLLEIGYEIEAVYGGFDMRPLDDSSKEQIWFVRRPI